MKGTSNTCLVAICVAMSVVATPTTADSNPDQRLHGQLLAPINEPARAQPRNCAPRAMVLDRLAQSYGESRQSAGLGGDNLLEELFASQESGSWTIIATSPNGLTCLVASGQSFQALQTTLPIGENDA